MLLINVLGTALATLLDKPCVYIGCMKSGEVFSELWHEPEWWKFGSRREDDWMLFGLGIWKVLHLVSDFQIWGSWTSFVSCNLLSS
ncbi:putative glycosyl transferase, family 31 [Rosa chinensis]|uniref:Putative glycosyl transferase, family 31 n=1 Tax=Rosa chinensis TaxID=74649 RepID=A0A2P6S7U3_ROSCH|nr:putative glycosyl transferase, family 31 [Rosa chinensis]